MDRAFTLVELIVTLAVIGVLISITLPFLGGAREAARRSECMSNMRSLSTAAGLYRNSRDDVLPWATRPVRIAKNRRAPLDQLAQFLDVPAPVPREVASHPSAPWRCPSDLTIAVIHGWSYVYLPMDIMNYYEFRTSAPGHHATRYFDERPDEPVFAEAEAFHARSRRDARRLVSTLDGAVSEAAR